MSVLVVAGIAGTMFVLLPAWVRPTVDRREVRIASVVRGPIEATLSASGRVVPLHEHVVVSPIDTRLKRILRRPGDAVAAGEPIVLLDVGEAEVEVSRLEDQIALGRNERDRVALGLANQLSEIRGRHSIKQLELKSLELELERRRETFAAGLDTQQILRKAETDVARSRIEVEQLEEAMGHAAGLAKAEIEGHELEVRMLERDRDEAARRLELASTGSEREGVVTWIVPSEGVSVGRGQELARIADLSSFRVEATLSDVHAGRVRAGLGALVQIGDETLLGTVASVRPTVEDGVLTLEVELDQPGSPQLRHNLRVDVQIVTERKPRALRIGRANFGRADGERVVFVVRGDTAVRTPVELGISSFDAYEVLAGLEEGDEVIVSDMADYMHVLEVALR